MSDSDFQMAIEALKHHQHVSAAVNYVLLGCLGLLAIGKLIKAFRS